MDHLPQSKRDTLRRITEVIRESATVEMIILFGSYASGDGVEDRENEYMSDFDILVVVTSAELAADDCWFDCKERARSMGGEIPVCIIVHTVEDVHHLVGQGNSFFRDVLTDHVRAFHVRAMLACRARLAEFAANAKHDANSASVLPG